MGTIFHPSLVHHFLSSSSSTSGTFPKCVPYVFHLSHSTGLLEGLPASILFLLHDSFSTLLREWASENANQLTASLLKTLQRLCTQIKILTPPCPRNPCMLRHPPSPGPHFPDIPAQHLPWPQAQWFDCFFSVTARKPPHVQTNIHQHTPDTH